MNNKNIINSFSWVGFRRLSTRGLSFLRIAILARLLTPASFGLYGIASLMLELLETLTETGINVFLVQEDDEDDYLNNAWFVSIVRGFFIFFILFLCSGIIARFFNAPASKLILIIISLVALARGFINPSIVKMQKQMNFKLEYKFKTIVFLFDSIVTVILAVILQSPISLAYGTLFGAIFEVILSFIYFKPHPVLKFESQKFLKVFHRGKWVTLAGIFAYLAENVDDIIVGKILGANSLGLYQQAYKISSLPITEITQISGRVTFPYYKSIASDRNILKKNFLKYSLVLSMIIIAIGMFIFIFPDLIVKILLGSNWLEVSNILKILALYGVVRALWGLANSLFLAVGKQEYITNLTFLQFVVLGILIIPFVLNFALYGAVYSAILAAIIPLPFAVYFLKKELK